MFWETVLAVYSVWSGNHCVFRLDVCALRKVRMNFIMKQEGNSLCQLRYFTRMQVCRHLVKCLLTDIVLYIARIGASHRLNVCLAVKITGMCNDIRMWCVFRTAQHYRAAVTLCEITYFILNISKKHENSLLYWHVPKADKFGNSL